MKLQCMKYSVIAYAVYLASVGIESFNMFLSFPTHPCLVHKEKKAGITNTYMPSRCQEEISELSLRGLLQAITAGEGMPTAFHGQHQRRRSSFKGQSRVGQGRAWVPLAPLNSTPLCYLSQQLCRVNQSCSFPRSLPQGCSEASTDTQPLCEEWTPALSQWGGQCLQDPSVTAEHVDISHLWRKHDILPPLLTDIKTRRNKREEGNLIIHIKALISSVWRRKKCGFCASNNSCLKFLFNITLMVSR